MTKLPIISLALSLTLHIPFVCSVDMSWLTTQSTRDSDAVAVYYISPEKSTVRHRTVIKEKIKEAQVIDSKEVDADSGKKTFFPFFSRKRNVTVETVLREKTRPQRLSGDDTEVDALAVHVPTVENICLDNPEVKKIFFSYYDDIREAIKQQTIYPYQAKAKGHFGQVYVSFVLKRDGAIREIVILDSSGVPALDDAALMSIRRAAPFQAFPELVEESEITLNVPISFELH